jgi:hypothetical protein
MVAFEKRFDAVTREFVLGVQPFRGVAVAADINGDFEWGTAL